MAQPVATQNFLVHDENGKPQVIKVVHTPANKWHSGSGNNAQMSVVRTSGIIRSSGTPVRQLYNDDDDDDDDDDQEGGTSTYVMRKGRPVAQTPQSSYKIVLNKAYDNQTEIVSNSSHLSRDGGSRLSLGTKRIAALRGNPTPVKRMSPELDYSQDSSYNSTGKRRRGEKGSKGLRHFSMKVCQKVKQKGRTTYNEVADELVSEFTGTTLSPGLDQSYDQKNIRRRVYDALNVLMAMNIISKEKKEIRWLGLPTGYPKVTKVRESTAGLERSIKTRIATKKKTLQNLILQQVAFKNLMQRNKENESLKGTPGAGAVIQLPMLVVSTNKNTTVNCSVSNDRKEYCFNFDDEFAIQDEGHVLQGMGMMMGLNTGDATPEDLIRAKTMIPRALHPYLEEMVIHNTASGAGSSSMMAAADDEEEEGTVYLEEDDSATDDDIEGH